MKNIGLLSYEDITSLNKVKKRIKERESFNHSLFIIKEFITERKKDIDLLKITALINQYHNGMRKGNLIPEIQHQYDIACDLIKYSELLRKSGLSVEKLIKIAFLHDLFEDYNQFEKIWEVEKEGRLIDKPFISKALLCSILSDRDIIEKSMVLSKRTMFGKKKKSKHYFREISVDPELVIIKMLDRKNSLKTMKGVFEEKKQIRYINQYKKEILIMSEKYKDTDLGGIFKLIREDVEKIIAPVCIKRVAKKRRRFG